MGKVDDQLLTQLYNFEGYSSRAELNIDLTTIDELYITMVTAGGDAADTAIKHGKLCAWLYPILGKLVSTCKVKKYDFDISPDFLATKSTAKAYVKLHVVPIRITNGAVVLAVQLAFKVLFKILFAKKKSDKL